MANEKNPQSEGQKPLAGGSAGKDGGLVIEGRVELEEAASKPADLTLKAYVFDRLGQLLGTGDVDARGTFTVPVKLSAPSDVELVIAPPDEPQVARKSAAYNRKYAATDWTGQTGNFRLNPNIFLPKIIWSPWWPVRVCVSGHVRKVHDGEAPCPVPYVKVEIFDVDREDCWWPYFVRWWDKLVYRPVIRVPEILKERLFEEPPPIPDPIGPVARLGIGALESQRVAFGQASFGETVGFNPQPDPPRWLSGTSLQAMGDEASGHEAMSMSSSAQTTVSPQAAQSMQVRSSDIATSVENLTLTSRIAPWLIFPRCFYSRRLVCTTYTDSSGFFRCCFNWPRFHFRNGRWRYDPRPDIIIRVTQVINGVETVIYMDPYASTRWNTTNAHIDLNLDNEEIQCGGGGEHNPLPGSPVFFTRIGDDEVYLINQNNGLYEVPPLSNVAYGGSLLVYAQFGDDLTDGSPARYYRLSYARRGTSTFTPITTPMSDTRVNKSTFFSESFNLGPVTVNGVTALYRVRNFASYYWYNPDWIGNWWTPQAEEDTGTYILRLEVFDETGLHLMSNQVDYRDGTVAPPAVLPPMTDPPRIPSPPSTRIHSCDLVITLDNKPPVVNLLIPAVLNECGVIPGSSVPPLDFTAQVSQENGRLRAWSLVYLKGINPVYHSLGAGSSGTSNTGSPATINQVVSGAPLLVGLTTTCAFALRLSATAHIRDGRNFIYHAEQNKAIAIENCPPCSDD
jgi:hypothetical protein